MTCVQSSLLVLVLAFSSLNYIESNKICSLRDAPCTTRAAQQIFKSMLDGVEGLFPILDPIIVPKLEGEYLSAKYKAYNITLMGMKQCPCVLLRLNPDSFIYVNKLRCPKLVLKFDYEANGLLGPIEFDGKASATITLNDYIIMLRGSYEEFISKKDNRRHFSLVNHNFEYECKGPVTVEVNGPLHFDKVKDAQTRDFVTTNSKEIEKIMQSTVMPSLMGDVVKAVDICLREVPIETVLEVVE